MTKRMLVVTMLFLAVILAGCKPQVVNERHVPIQIKQIMDQHRYTTAKWGFYVKDLTDNKIIYRQNPNKLFIPASVTKLFAVSALLHRYGSEHVFKTPIYALGKIDEKGVFTGNLVLVGQGDLMLGGRLGPGERVAYTSLDHLYAGFDCYNKEMLTPQDPLAGIKSLAKQIKANGIKSISGNVLVDNRLFETVTSRGHTVSPVMLNDNVIDIKAMPTEPGKPATIESRPQLSQLRVVNQVMTNKIGEKSALFVTKNSGGDQLVVSGTVSVDRKNILAISPVQDPQKFVQMALTDALFAEGITVTPNAMVPNTLPPVTAYQNTKPAAMLVSLPLIETAKLIWKVSHNSGANLVPLLLASAEGKTTYNEGMQLLGHFFTDTVYLNPNEISFLDAEGGDSNYVSCDSVIKLLEYMYHLSPVEFAKHIYALPILGVDGTLEYVGRQTPARGHVFAKTGTGMVMNKLNGSFLLTSQSLAGFIQAKNGHWLAFMVVVNSIPLKEICDMQAVGEDLANIATRVYEG